VGSGRGRPCSLLQALVSDPTRLKQIVMNFVANAIKFTESGTVRILVRCERPDSPLPKLVIDVTDTGIGMTEAEMQRLFRSFSQADASTTRRFGGSGLGLLISKRLAELLGGEVSVESAPGRGSVFRVSIPTGSLLGVPMIEGLMEAGVVDTPAQSVRRVASLPPSCRVLLAEDGYDNQVLVTVLQFMRDLPERSSAILRASQASDLETRFSWHHRGGVRGRAGHRRRRRSTLVASPCR
jgi:hypothetical protein